MPKHLEEIEVWRIWELQACTYHLILDSINQSAILREIQHISFPILKKIDLWRNQIESIEELCRMDMPVLEYLNLSIFVFT